MRREKMILAKEILIVTSEPGFDGFLETALDGVVQRIHWARSVKAAQGALDERKVDLIVSDFRLDGVATGFDLWFSCRRRFPQTPFILLSGFTLGVFDRLLRGTQSGGPHILCRPFSGDELRDRIRRIFDVEVETRPAATRRRAA